MMKLHSLCNALYIQETSSPFPKIPTQGSITTKPGAQEMTPSRI